MVVETEIMEERVEADAIAEERRVEGETFSREESAGSKPGVGSIR
jgi:hypothetical protein